MAHASTAEERLTLAIERGIIVDPEDEWLLQNYTWHLNDDGYPRARMPETGQLVFLHHCIAGYPIWEGDEIDHEDRNKLNNRRGNLRYVDHYTQTLNRDFPVGETGARNITLRKNGKFKVQLYRYNKWIYLGQFDTLDEAVAERDEWLSQHGEYVSSTK
jgi:hypothetical protein